MISIVICSRTKGISKFLETNIDDTIGYDYELVIIDNSNNDHSIFEAYNLGISRCKGNYLCFMHDDIAFNTNNWGQIINEIFEMRTQVGLIGVVGSKIKTRMPSGWNTNNSQFNILNIIQHEQTRKKVVKQGFSIASEENVITVDGVFMVARKSTGILFNESFEGFHNYDISFSIDHILNGYEIVVTKNVEIEHFSTGFFNSYWLSSVIDLHEVYKKHLPLSVDSIQVRREHETNALKLFIIRCCRNKKYKLSFNYWLKLIQYNPFTIFHVKYQYNYIFKNILKIDFRKLIYKIGR